MKKCLTLMWFVVVGAPLMGCATKPVPVSHAADVPASRVYYSSKPVATGSARAVFIRDAGFTGAGVHDHLYINGTKAASFAPGEKAEFVLTPGEYIFGIIPTNVFGTHSLNSIDQDLKADRQYFYRIQTDGNSMRTVLQRFMPNE